MTQSIEPNEELARLPPEFRDMPLGDLLKHFSGADAPQIPDSVAPWLDVARKVSRMQTVNELRKIRDALSATITRLLNED